MRWCRAYCLAVCDLLCSLCRTCWQRAQPAVSREAAPRQQLHHSSAGSMSHAAAPSKAQMQQEAIAEASSKLLVADAADQGATCKGRSRAARPRIGTQVTHEGQGSTVAAAKPSRPRRQAARSTKVATQQSSSATSISSSILASGSAAAGAGATDCAQHRRDDLGSTGDPAKASRLRGVAACNVKVVKPQQDSRTSISRSSMLASSNAAAGALDMEPSASAGSVGRQTEEGPSSTAAPAKLSGFRQAKAGNARAGKELHLSSSSSSSTPTSSNVAALADPLDEDPAAPATDCEQPPEQHTVGKARRPAVRRTGRTASSKAAAGTSRRAVTKVNQEQRPACQQAAASKAAVGSHATLPAISNHGRERACLPAAVSPVTQTQPRTRMSR